MESEATLNAGDVCLDCQHNGFEKYLRYFKINLHGDTILKCESNQCMYPYNDELSSSDDDDDVSKTTVSQTNSLKLINDLIRQFDYEEAAGHESASHVPITESDAEQVTQFDITFLDDFNATDNASLCKTETADKQVYFPLDEAKPMKYDISSENSSDNTRSQNFQTPQLDLPSESYKNPYVAYEMDPDDNNSYIKHKITIQSIETLQAESPLYHELPTTSKNLLMTRKYSAAADNQQQNASTPEKTAQNSNKLKKNKIKSETKVLDSIDPSSAPPTTVRKRTPKKSKPLDIPKADIQKANAVLKKFATSAVTVKETDDTPKYNRKYKSIRKRDLKGPELNDSKHSYNVAPELAPALQNTDSDYSFDKITQMLLAKK